MKLCTVLFYCYVAHSVFALSLIPCPDCGQQVSQRAMMYPNCGCNSTVIADAAKALQVKAKSKVNPPAKVLQGASDRGTFDVYPVRLDKKYLLVAPLSEAEGVNTLLVSNAVHQVTVNYCRPAVAEDLPLIIFETAASTNIVFRAAADLPKTVRYDGREVPVSLSETSVFVPITLKTLRADGRLWRTGVREAEKFHHPFYKRQCRLVSGEKKEDGYESF